MDKKRDYFRFASMMSIFGGIYMPANKNEQRDKDDDPAPLSRQALAGKKRSWANRANKRKLRQGLTKFNIEGHIIWALNEKNAIRKHKKYHGNNNDNKV